MMILHIITTYLLININIVVYIKTRNFTLLIKIKVINQFKYYFVFITELIIHYDIDINK